MDIEHKKGQSIDIINPEKIRSRSNILSQLGYEGSEDQQNKRVTEVLQRTKYFDGILSNPVQRRDFVEAIAPYADLRFYPKGTTVYFHGEPLSKFSIIVKGKAVLYIPKKYTEDISKDIFTIKQEVIKIYTEVIRQELFQGSKKPKESSTKSVKEVEDLIVVRKRMTQIINETINLKLNDGLTPVIERIMSGKDINHIAHLRNSDLSPEEKLLLLANIGDADDYYRHADFDMKAVGHLGIGGTISDINLLQTGYAEYTVVAEEDLYLALFTKDEYLKAYNTGAPDNLNEKTEFLAKLFPSIAKDSRRKIALFLEEKQFVKGGIIYKKGSEAEEFYLIKDGEIELLSQKGSSSSSSSSTMARSSSNEKYIERKLALNISASDRFTVGKLQEGMMFGEVDIFNAQPRQFYAVSRRPNTFLYTIKKKAYFDVFHTYYYHIALVFKDWFNSKMRWLSERIDQEVKKFERVGDENVDIPITKREMLQRLEKPKNFTNLLSINFSSRKKKPKELDDDERLKNQQLKLKSSLNMKFPLSFFPNISNDALATTHYQKLRNEHIDPISTKRRYNPDRTPIELKKLSISNKNQNKTSLFRKNQVELRKETRHLFLPVTMSKERKPAISRNSSCSRIESMMLQAIDLHNTSPKVGIKVPPLEEKSLKANDSLVNIDFIPSDRYPQSITKLQSPTKNTRLKSLIAPLNIPSADLLSSTLGNFSSRKVIHDKSPVEIKPRIRHKKKRNMSIEGTPKSFLATKRETREWIPPISPAKELQGWSIAKFDHGDSIDELSQEMRTPSLVDLYDT